jgi:hypothetical protein
MSTAYKTRIPTRIRFMIMDTIELKDNNWIPRGSRTEPESCNTNAKSNAGRPEIKQSTHVQNISAVLPTVRSFIFYLKKVIHIHETI